MDDDGARTNPPPEPPKREPPPPPPEPKTPSERAIKDLTERAEDRHGDPVEVEEPDE